MLRAGKAPGAFDMGIENNSAAAEEPARQVFASCFEED